MSRKKIITRTQRKADTARTQINAAETSRVAMLILDEVEAEMERLYARSPDVLSLQDDWNDLLKFISRAKRKHSKRRGGR